MMRRNEEANTAKKGGKVGAKMKRSRRGGRLDGGGNERQIGGRSGSRKAKRKSPAGNPTGCC